MMTPSDSRRFEPVVSSLVRNLPLNSAASSAIQSDGLRPSKLRSSAGNAVISQSADPRLMRLKRTWRSVCDIRMAIVRAVSRQIQACSSLFAITWTRRPSPASRSHSASPAIKVVFPLPRATCTMPSFTRRRPSSTHRQPIRFASAQTCHGCSSKARPESSPTSDRPRKCSTRPSTASKSITRSVRSRSRRQRDAAA